MQSPIKHSNTRLVETLRLPLLHAPKRIGLLGGLLTVMLILWGRLLFNGPASATASLIHRSTAANIDLPPLTRRTPVSNPVMDWIAQPRRPVDRNLFSINPDFYPAASEQTGYTTADADPPQQIPPENLQTQAAQFKLQTTMMASSPSAIVNGELVKEGDLVAGFTVVRIEARKIVLQQAGVMLEISMP